MNQDKDTNPAPVIPDAVWQGRGGAVNQRIRIVDTRSDGRVVVERTAGAPGHAMRRELTVTLDQLRAAFEPLSDGYETERYIPESSLLSEAERFEREAEDESLELTSRTVLRVKAEVIRAAIKAASEQ